MLSLKTEWVVIMGWLLTEVIWNVRKHLSPVEYCNIQVPGRLYSVVGGDCKKRKYPV